MRLRIPEGRFKKGGIGRRGPNELGGSGNEGLERIFIVELERRDRASINLKRNRGERKERSVEMGKL